MGDQLDELRRLGDSFAATIRAQERELQGGLRSMSAAIDQAAARLAAVMPGGAALAPAPTPAAAAGGPALAPGGILQVRVVNDRLPVFVVNPPPAPERPGGLFGTIATGIGGFLGGIVGGIVGGVAAPVLLFADIAALMIGLPGILDRVQNILRLVRTIATELVTGLRGLITLLFSELTAAGIFPVSRLIASLLFLIDRGITLVLMHVQPIIIWVERVIQAVVLWLQGFISRASAFVGGVINALANFVIDLVTYLIDVVIRPALSNLVRDLARTLTEIVVSGLFGSILAMKEVLVATLTWGGQFLRFAILSALASIPGLGSAITVPAPPPALDIEPALRAGAARGAVLGRAFASSLILPAPAPPGTTPRPRLRMPGFGREPLVLPDFPTAAPQLERLLETPPATTGPESTTPAATQTTVNGGISVAIRSETVSMENAEETARVIAQHVMDELVRLNQADRFGRGLPTASVA